MKLSLEAGSPSYCVDVVSGVSRMLRSRKPRAEVCAVVVFNDQDVDGRWIPMRLEIDSWVTLRAAARGHWGRDARAHGEESAAGAWKAQIKQFRWSVQDAASTRTPKLEAVLVRHAYLRRQIQLDPDVAHNEPHCANYLYASFWEDVLGASLFDTRNYTSTALRSRRGYQK